MKSIKDRIIEQKALPIAGAPQFSIVNGQLVPTPDNKQSYIDNGYNINDIVYSVVNIILDKVRVAPWGLYKVTDESSLKSRNGLLRKKNLTGEDYKKVLELSRKALEPINNPSLGASKLAELLKWPNPNETYSDYVAASCGFKLLTGDKFTWANILDAGANKGVPQELWCLPSQSTKVLATMGFPPKKVGYQLDGYNLKYTPEEVLHEIYWNPNWGINNQQLSGMSPLRAALKTLTRNNSAKDASSAKFQNNGLEAIIYVDDNRLTGDVAAAQATALKSKLISEYSGPKNMGKIATSGYKVGVANLGLSPVELGIIEAEKWDALMICAIYGVPPELLGITAKTYNNIVEAEKALTTRSALPLLTSHRESFNQKLQTDWGFKGQNVYVDFDLSVYTELQENIKEKVEWMSQLKGLPLNRQLEMLGLETIDSPLFDEPWITPDMGQPLSEWDANPVDQALNDNTKP